MKILSNILFVPKKTIDVAKLIKKSGKSSEKCNEIIQNIGFTKLTESNTKNTSKFIEKCLSNLSPKSFLLSNKIQYLIVVSQSFNNRIPNLSSTLQPVLGLPQKTFCIDIIDGCNGFVKALTVANKLMSVGQRTLIVAGDLNSIMTEKAEISTKVLFGDGFCFTVVEQTDFNINSEIYNDGSRGRFISSSISPSIMYMDGFEVFRFTNEEVPKLLKNNYLNKLLAKKPLHYYALHQASKFIIEQIAKRSSLDNGELSLFACKEIGNLGAGSIGAWISLNPLLLKRKCLLTCVGYGAGLSWGRATIKSELLENEMIRV